MNKLRISKRNKTMDNIKSRIISRFYVDPYFSISFLKSRLPLNSGVYSSTAKLIDSRSSTADLNKKLASWVDNDSPSYTRFWSFLKGFSNSCGTTIKNILVVYNSWRTTDGDYSNVNIYYFLHYEILPSPTNRLSEMVDGFRSVSDSSLGHFIAIGLRVCGWTNSASFNIIFVIAFPYFNNSWSWKYTTTIILPCLK